MHCQFILSFFSLDKKGKKRKRKEKMQFNGHHLPLCQCDLNNDSTRIGMESVGS